MTRFEKLVGLAAVLALFVYALACRPSWSPDSSAIVFTYTTENSFGVAVHNVETGRTENVITFAENDSQVLPQVVWQENKIVILLYGQKGFASEQNNQTFIMEYDPKVRAFGSISMLDLGEAQVSPMTPPVADTYGRIFLGGIESGGNGIIRIEADRKKFQALGPDKVFILDRGKNNIFYATMNKDETLAEIGLFMPDAEEFKVLAGFESSEAGKLNPSLAAAPDGSRCCLTVTKANGRFDLIVVEADGSNSRRFGPNTSIVKVGGVAFAGDSKTVWMAAMEKETDSDEPRIVLAEYVFEKERGERLQRRIALPIESKDIDDDMVITLQPTVSPDGRWLALSTFIFEQKKSSRLFLVDLESADLDLKIINAPVAD